MHISGYLRAVVTAQSQSLAVGLGDGLPSAPLSFPESLKGGGLSGLGTRYKINYDYSVRIE